MVGSAPLEVLSTAHLRVRGRSPSAAARDCRLDGTGRPALVHHTQHRRGYAGPLTAVIVLGTYRSAFPRSHTGVIVGLHRSLSLGSVGFAAAHAFAAIFDPFAGIRLIDTAFPLLSGYRRFYMGLGTLSADLFGVALAITRFTHRIGRRAWLWLHRIGYLAWAAAVVHSLGAGSDTRRTTFVVLDLSVVVVVLLTVCFWRFLIPGREREALRVAGAVGLAAIAAALMAWTLSGPMSGGWARSAGTPERLLEPTPSPPYP